MTMTDETDQVDLDVQVLQTDIVGDNVDPDGVAHACGIGTDGVDYCLGCRKPWPCGDAIRLRVEELAPAAAEVTPEAVIATSVSTGLPWPVVADQLAVEREDVQAFLDAGAA